MDLIAIIPARSGSKSIIDKNIAHLSGHPLLAYSIAAAKCSSLISRVIVSTDSEQYAELAIRYGAEVPFIRPAEFSTDTSTDRDFLVHAMKWLEDNEKILPEYWIHLRPTTPLREPEMVDEAIKIIQGDVSSTSLRSGHRAPESPFKWFHKDKEGYFKGLLNGDNNTEIYNLPKEAFDVVFIPDGYVDIVRRSFVMTNLAIHGDKMIGFESPVSTEVDSIEEFEYIQYQLDKKGSRLLKYLDSRNMDGAL
jgi:CMP-N,N'-diacetyllegionaminic acid synthase